MKLLGNRILKFLVISTIFFMLSLPKSEAQIIDSSFYQWRVYEIQETELDYKKCYMIARPATSESDENSRRKPYVMISRFQKDRSEEVSIYGGFEYKLSGKISILLDRAPFELKVKGDMAWARTKDEDVKIISTMLKSGVMKVRSDSAIGNYAVDEYSLKGITRAYLRMREVCK